MTGKFDVARLTAGDIAFAREALGLFGEVFEDLPAYCANQPGDAWLTELLGDPNFVFQIARDDARLVLEKDPELVSERGTALRVLLYLFEKDAVVKTIRSG